jgi:hypothetical protein
MSNALPEVQPHHGQLWSETLAVAVSRSEAWAPAQQSASGTSPGALPFLNGRPDEPHKKPPGAPERDSTPDSIPAISEDMAVPGNHAASGPLNPAQPVVTVSPAEPGGIPGTVAETRVAAAGCGSAGTVISGRKL